MSSNLISSLVDIFNYFKNIKSTSIKEERDRITFEGSCFNPEIVKAIKDLIAICSIEGLPRPVIRINEQSFEDEDEWHDHYNKSWRVILSKVQIAQILETKKEESLFFFSVENFEKWANNLNHLAFSIGSNFDKEINIYVAGLDKSFGGEYFSVIPADKISHTKRVASKLPDSEKVQSIVRTNNSDVLLQINPRYWNITWGDRTGRLALSFIRTSCLVLAASIVTELRCKNRIYEVSIRGIKQKDFSLWHLGSELKWERLEKQLVDVVSWIYEDKSETKLNILLDRISIDANDSCWIANLYRILDSAFKQAKDSYIFVINERKDAYNKEMRDVLKDMKSQADLYASKVRDLVNNASRDALGIIIFIGLSFVNKFDPGKLLNLLGSKELSVFSKFLAVYLLLSCLLQMVTHITDSILSYKESEKWLFILRNYTSSKDAEDRFLNPIKTRRDVLFFALFITFIIYVALIIIVWNLGNFSKLLLNQ